MRGLFDALIDLEPLVQALEWYEKASADQRAADGNLAHEVLKAWKEKYQSVRTTVQQAVKL